MEKRKLFCVFCDGPDKNRKKTKTQASAQQKINFAKPSSCANTSDKTTFYTQPNHSVQKSHCVTCVSWLHLHQHRVTTETSYQRFLFIRQQQLQLSVRMRSPLLSNCAEHLHEHFRSILTVNLKSTRIAFIKDFEVFIHNYAEQDSKL